jgi:lysophospholipase L1-like esterase
MYNIQQWKEHPETSHRIIAFGSSNTEMSWSNAGRHNWVEWLNLNLREHIGKHVCVINQGIGGETTEDLLLRLGRDVLSFQPSVVIVTIGGNDAKKGIPLEKFSENLRKICSLIQDSNAQPMLQTYYCPMYHLRTDNFKGLFESFIEANRVLAKEMDLLLVDQYRHFEPFYRNHPEEYGQMMRDWIHVNHLGNLVMGMHISSKFQLPDLPIPQDIEQEALELIDQMRKCFEK